jgi:hypothetical protein
MGTCRVISLIVISFGLVVGVARAQEGANEGEQRVLADVKDAKGRPWSEGVPLEKRHRAYELFLEGNSIIKEGFFGKAADKYKEAAALWDHPAFHYNLAIAQMNLDQLIDAYERFLAARSHGPRPITTEKFDQAQKYLDMLRKQLGEIEVICNEPGAEVAVDGKPLFAGPGRQRVMVRPGGHRTEATKRGYLPGIEQVVLNPGDSKRITVTPQLPEYLVTVRRWPEWIPWALVGAGAVVLAGAGTLDHLSTRRFDEFDRDFNARCGGVSLGCMDANVPDELHAKLEQGRALQWGGRVTYLIGGVTAMTSVSLLYLNRERIVRERGLLNSGRMSLNPMLMPHGAGMNAQLRF